MPVFVFVTPWAFFMGACIGSFLNVCIYRIPLDIALSRPKRSFCPHCERTIDWYHNVPILGWLLLKGHCRYCCAPISARYILVEALVACLFVLAWLKFDLADGPRFLKLVPVTDGWLVPVYWLLFSGLVVGTFVDLEHLIIPDRISMGGIVAGLVLSGLLPSLHGVETAAAALWWSSLGVLAGSGTLWAAGVLGKMVFKKEAMGFGDVKLLGAIGAFLGPASILFVILVSSLLGSIVGLTLVATKRRELQGKIPFGPYLAIAAVIWILWGPAMWDAYMGLFRPAVG